MIKSRKNTICGIVTPDISKVSIVEVQKLLQRANELENA